MLTGVERFIFVIFLTNHSVYCAASFCRSSSTKYHSCRLRYATEENQRKEESVDYKKRRTSSKIMKAFSKTYSARAIGRLPTMQCAISSGGWNALHGACQENGFEPSGKRALDTRNFFRSRDRGVHVEKETSGSRRRIPVFLATECLRGRS